MNEGKMHKLLPVKITEITKTFKGYDGARIISFRETVQKKFNLNLQFRNLQKFSSNHFLFPPNFVEKIACKTYF